jgi:drug/metabolite transporter (DMT)-like permease
VGFDVPGDPPGVQDLPPAMMAGARFLIAGLIMMAWLLYRRVPFPPRRMLGPIAVTGILLLFGGNFLVTWSEIYVSSGMAAVIVANLPFFMTGLEAMRRDGERLSPLGVLGLLVGFSGMLILMWPKIAAIEGGRSLGDFRGEFALLGANICWATGSIYSKHRVKGVAPLMAVGLEMLIAGLALLGFGLLLGEVSTDALRAAVGADLAGCSLLVHICLNHVPAAKVSTYAYVNPIIAVVLGWAVLGERLDLRMAVGTGVILGGVAAVNAARVRFSAR